METTLGSMQVAASFLLLLVPLIINTWFGLGQNRAMLVAAGRMVLQLSLIGLFLKYLYAWNQPLLNLGWLLVMVLVASYSAIRDSGLKIRSMLLPVFAAFGLSTLFSVLYLDKIVFQVDHWFDAQYMVVFGGMILGNALRGNIVGISAFYQTLRKEQDLYLTRLAQGATAYEAMLPWLRQAARQAMRPSLAGMAVVGVVSLPGMMTGALLGGASPQNAIQFQIVIMLAIFASSSLSIVLAILFTRKRGFDAWGILNPAIFSRVNDKGRHQ